MLRLRKTKLLPQQVSDLGAFIFVVAMIPVTYLWEVLVVSPALFPDQQQALGWVLHMAFGLLVVVNIAGNFGGGKNVTWIKSSIVYLLVFKLMVYERSLAGGHLHNSHSHPLLTGEIARNI